MTPSQLTPASLKLMVWRKQNPDKAKAICQSYYKKNRERILKLAKKRYLVKKIEKFRKGLV